jgi:hypothetical protein
MNPAGRGTLQHAGQIKLCNSDCNQNRAIIWSFDQLGHDACQPGCVVASPGPSFCLAAGRGYYAIPRLA